MIQLLSLLPAPSPGPVRAALLATGAASRFALAPATPAATPAATKPPSGTEDLLPARQMSARTGKDLPEPPLAAEDDDELPEHAPRDGGAIAFAWFAVAPIPQSPPADPGAVPATLAAVREAQVGQGAPAQPTDGAEADAAATLAGVVDAREDAAASPSPSEERAAFSTELVQGASPMEPASAGSALESGHTAPVVLRGAGGPGRAGQPLWAERQAAQNDARPLAADAGDRLQGSASAARTARIPPAPVPLAAVLMPPAAAVEGPLPARVAVATSSSLRGAEPGSASFSSLAAFHTAPPHAVAAPADVQPPLLDTRRQEWVGKVVEHIEALRDAGPARETRLSLAPESLGKVEVSIRQEGDRVHVHFTTETSAARQLIVDAQPRLGELAEARGLKLGQTSFDSGTAGQGAHRDGREQPGSPQSHAPRPANPGSTVGTADDDRIA